MPLKSVPPRVPPRPSRLEERLASRLLLALSPRLPRTEQPPPPVDLAPSEVVDVPRAHRPGTLTATWFPAPEPARGAVLLLPPWTPWGRAYFHRRGRIEALRAAGYHSLALDLPGFGGSGAPDGFFDRDVEDGLAFLRRQSGALPLHVWGVSSGGYWAHVALARSTDVTGAVFEDVTQHLFSWSWRMAPWGAPVYLFFRTAFRRSHRFMDVRRHAPATTLAAAAYIGGGRDRGIRAEETEELARLAGGRSLVVPGAEHLASIRIANAEILELAVETFERAEAARRPPPLNEKKGPPPA